MEVTPGEKQEGSSEVIGVNVAQEITVSVFFKVSSETLTQKQLLRTANSWLAWLYN